jgi:hypothetical protein
LQGARSFGDAGYVAAQYSVPMLRRLTCFALFAATAILPSCGSTEPSTRTAPPKGVVEACARVHGDVASLLGRAGSTPRLGGLGVVVSTRGLYAEIGAGGSVALRGEASLAMRVEGAQGRPRIEGRHAIVGDLEGASIVFDRGSAIELLHRIARPTPLVYALDLPRGTSLRRVEDGGGGVVELLDESRVPRLRLTADAAWDRDGRRLQPTLRLDGARVAIELPRDAAYPVLVDPAWSVTTFPVRLRSLHTSTLLGTGEVLLAGGGTATAETFDAVSGRFSSTGAMLDARPGHSATLLRDGTVLLAGGSGATSEIYDPVTRAFRAGPAMASIAGSNVAVRLLDGTVLAIGGGKADRYDPATKTWTAVTRKTTADGPPVLLTTGDVLVAGAGAAEIFRVSTSTFTALATPAIATPTAFGLQQPNGDAIVFDMTYWSSPGGASGSAAAKAWFFNSKTGTFTAKTNGGGPLAVAVHPSGRVMFVGAGVSYYDPATDTSSTGTLPQDQDGGAITLLPSGSVLVTGGNSGGASIYQGDGALGPGTWTSAGAMRVGRVLGRATRLLDGRVLIVGGHPPATNTSDATTTAEVWAPSVGWKAVGALSASRVSQAQALLASGKVLVAGGSGGSSAELFDPTKNTFAATGSLSVARDGATATLLPNGKVLIAGGSNPTSTSTAEIFEESTGTFRVLASKMSAPHALHGAVLLPNGRVLIVDRTTTELFDPATEAFVAGPTLSSARDGRTAGVLPNGDVVVGGNAAALLRERYSLATNAFTPTGPFAVSTIEESSAATPFGRVFMGVGTNRDHEFSDGGGWMFDALGDGGRGSAAPLGSYAPPRTGGALVPTIQGGVLQAGGDDCAGACGHPTTCSTDTGLLDATSKPTPPTIASAPASVTPGVAFAVTGTAFEGTRDSTPRWSTRVPLFVWVPASGQGSVRATTLSFTDGTAQVRLPSTGYRGKGFLHVAVAGVTSAGVLVDLVAAANGAACGGPEACASGHCVDGVCCDTACQGVCLACTAAKKGSGADGTCGAIPPEASATDACALFQGAPCASDAQCGTGICADGVCCDARCDGQCEACSVEKSVGTCVPVVGAPKGSRAACATGSDVCAARRCDGTTRDGCAGYAPATTSCRVAGCTGGVETLAATCTGGGACPDAATKACEPFACGDGACLTRCTADTECAPTYRCAAGKCVTGTYCADERTQRAPGAADVDCAPYVCEGQACRTSCDSSTQCQGGYLCSGGSCVTPPSATGDEGGCAAAGANGGEPSALAALGLGLVGLAIARRRARARG